MIFDTFDIFSLCSLDHAFEETYAFNNLSLILNWIALFFSLQNFIIICFYLFAIWSCIENPPKIYVLKYSALFLWSLYEFIRENFLKTIQFKFEVLQLQLKILLRQIIFSYSKKMED